MRSILMVPIHLDALCLETGLSAVNVKCDFSRLPYSNGEREFSSDIANISEELLAQPLQDRGLQLWPGVHLHWALPAALTKGRNTSENVQRGIAVPFPSDPFGSE